MTDAQHQDATALPMRRRVSVVVDADVHLSMRDLILALKAQGFTTIHAGLNELVCSRCNGQGWVWMPSKQTGCLALHQDCPQCKGGGRA